MSEKNSVTKIAGGLAGAAALAAGSGAYATVVAPSSLPADLTLPAVDATNFSPWDIDGDGNNDFLFAVSNSNGPFTGSTWSATVFGYASSVYAPYAGIGQNMVAGYAGPFFANYANNLPGGADIGSQTFSPGQGVYGQTILGSVYYYGGLNYYGQFAGAGSAVIQGYVGLMFSNALGSHNAWIEVRVSTNGGVEFLSAGWNDAPKSEPSGGIAAGEVPAPGTLAAMALGAVAFSRRSRRDD